MTDRVMQEDTMITAVRGGEAGAIMVPMARGDSEVAEGQPASWHIKVIEKASVKGNIYIGVETMDEKGNHYTRIGEDWYTEKAKDRAFYYRFIQPRCRLHASSQWMCRAFRCAWFSAFVERSTISRDIFFAKFTAAGKGVCHALCRHADARAHGRVHDENSHALIICVWMHPQFGWRHLHWQCHRSKGRSTLGIGRFGPDPDREQHSDILQERRDDWQH
jgi:hypothetical protein